MDAIRSRLEELEVLVVVPTYNNASTIADVVENLKVYSASVLVVNDGSTDSTAEILSSIEGIEVVSYPKNKGKGYALKLALRYAAGKGYRYLISMDADGQHFANDLGVFACEIQQTPDALLVGARDLQADNMPSKNTFANKFSNFWFRVETGIKMSDTQSGFRIYPVRRLSNIKFITPRYEFEVEVLVRAAWSGITVRNIPIKVYYPPQEERVSHFRPLRDFTRISILNSFLVLTALLAYYPWKFVRALTKENIKNFIRTHITNSSDSNGRLSGAIGLGVFFGIVPIWGYQMITAGVAAHLLRLNKVVTIMASNISIPPMIPFILYGSYYTGGLLLGTGASLRLSEMTIETVSTSLLQYVLGAIVFAIVCGALIGFVSYMVMIFAKRKRAQV